MVALAAGDLVEVASVEAALGASAAEVAVEAAPVVDGNYPAKIFLLFLLRYDATKNSDSHHLAVGFCMAG